MTKVELAKKLAANSHVTQFAAKKLIDLMLEEISAELKGGGTVTLPGFGTFKTKDFPERAGRNPRNGEAITISARTAVSFKPGTTLKREVNGK